MLRLGHSIGDIAYETKASPETVKRWKRRFAADGTEADRPRAGRPKKVTDASKDAILEARGKRKHSVGPRDQGEGFKGSGRGYSGKPL